MQLLNMRSQLKKHQDQASSLKEKNLEWTNDLKNKLNDLRSRGKKWEEETSKLRSENKELKVSHVLSICIHIYNYRFLGSICGSEQTIIRSTKQSILP